MAYADFDFYKNGYYGSNLTEQNATLFLERASDELDAVTFNRLVDAFPEVEAHISKVKKAVCAVADAIFLVEAHREAVAMQKAEDGTYRGSVASVSSGRESIHYQNTSANASVYAAAAANEQAFKALIRDTACTYFAGIPDARGTNLLYAGWC